MSDAPPTVTRDEAIDMLHVAIFLIKQKKDEAAIGQLYYLIDSLELATAMDELDIARELGVPEFCLCN